MGCSINAFQSINLDQLHPPVNANFKNTRVKTNLFPEGEINYLRNYKELQKENIKENKEAKNETQKLLNRKRFRSKVIIII